MGSKTTANGGRAGIREVAQQAGVGIASVSRVLSGQPGVSPQMAERVLHAARELGYVPNALAQNLRRRSTRTVGFVCSDITNPLLASIVSGAESVLSAAGYSVLLTNSGGDAHVDAQRIEVLLQRQVDGLILLPALEDDAATLAVLAATEAPFVVIDRSLPQALLADAVLSDHYRGVGEAARALLDGGHRRLGLVVGRDVRPSRERINAVRDAYTAAGLEPDVLIEPGTLSVEHGSQALQRLLASPRPPTAVILGGNQLLEGALAVIKQHRLALGTQLSLVCCDDVPLGRLHEPPIATVMRDTGLLGKRAAERLLEQLGQRQGAEHILLPTWFEWRGSCGPLPKG